jgi:WD40 repeat protein
MKKSMVFALSVSLLALSSGIAQLKTSLLWSGKQENFYIQFSKTGKRIYGLKSTEPGLFANLAVYKAASGAMILETDSKVVNYPSYAVSDDDRFIASFDKDPAVTRLSIMDAKSGKKVNTIDLGSSGYGLPLLAFKPRSHDLAIMGGCLEIRSIPDLKVKLACRPAMFDGLPRAMVFSPDGRYALISMTRTRPTAIDSTTGKRVLDFLDFQTSGLSLTEQWTSFSPDGRFVTGCSGDASGAPVFDLQTRKVKFRLPGRGFTCAGFSPDGRWIATNTIGNARLWDAKTGKSVRKLPEFLKECTDPNRSVGFSKAPVFSPDSRLLLDYAYNCSSEMRSPKMVAVL